MEIRILRINQVPGHVMRFHSLVTALVEVCSDGFSGCGSKFREEVSYEGVGNLIRDLPAVLGAVCLGCKFVLTFEHNAVDVEMVCTDAQVHTGCRVELNVQVPGISGDGAEEELQAAVFAGLA